MFDEEFSEVPIDLLVFNGWSNRVQAGII